ncbi:PREDICTED: uncharacterized protein LOC108379754 [Rhagoletis zephyria]|uniref:uncharacterized protein LOC108379754 n=1 Tax=Rhagoletis zephyria TaxID=28612 RepID=UPI0008113AD4|nr:PREDICTED: uncharacterized protein LOC108379754 [Rhagoletis zephyria]
MESDFHYPEQTLEQQQQIESTEEKSLTSIASDHCTPQNSEQRLIPLTQEIVKAMMEFDGSQSSTSLSEKNFYNTFSITSLVREEVQNILQELCVTDQFIRKEEIDALIERCLREKVTIDCKSTTTSAESLPPDSQEIEVTVEMLNETDKNKLIVENFQILEQRITNLEERISTVLQTVPKLRHLQAKKFKINTEIIREELRNVVQRMVVDEATKVLPTSELRSAIDGDVNGIATKATISITGTEKESTENKINPYDDLYYAQRQNAMNILNYKKSKATMELNQRPQLTPHIKPIVCELGEIGYKPKQKPTFIAE